MKKLTLIPVFILLITSLNAQIINVPADQLTIQEGIDAASDGDTVLVAEGKYFENINFNGKAITVASHFILDQDTIHIDSTIINGSQPENPTRGSVVLFENEEDTTSVLAGFTITGGTGTVIIEDGYNLKAGGGINLISSGAKLLNNYIQYNELNYSKYVTGGGISAGGLVDPQPWLVLRNNIIRFNKAISTTDEANGGGVEAYCNIIMDSNLIIENIADGAFRSLGAGVSIWGLFGHIEAFVTDNTIRDNILISNSDITVYAQSGGISIREDCEGIISGNTIRNNSIEVPSDKPCFGPGLMTWKAIDDLVVENNIIENNTFFGSTCAGGGLCIWFGAGVYQNNVIRNNQATHGGGIALSNDNPNAIPSLINNTIVENEGLDFGSGLYIESADAVIFNSIIWGNFPYSNESIIEEEADLEVRHSNIEGEEEWPGQGNMNVDPEFQEDGYHLHWPSLLVNEGRSTILIDGEWYDAPGYDIDGDERPFNGTYPDIGADEALWHYVSTNEMDNPQHQTLNIHPNPFASATTIEFELKSASFSKLVIYNLQGEIVDVVSDKYLVKGKHSISWQNDKLPAGIYYCVLKTGNISKTTKLIKLK